jgi:hypothetical protein
MKNKLMTKFYEDLEIQLLSDTVSVRLITTPIIGQRTLEGAMELGKQIVQASEIESSKNSFQGIFELYAAGLNAIMVQLSKKSNPNALVTPSLNSMNPLHITNGNPIIQNSSLVKPPQNNKNPLVRINGNTNQSGISYEYVNNNESIKNYCDRPDGKENLCLILRNIEKKSDELREELLEKIHTMDRLTVALREERYLKRQALKQEAIRKEAQRAIT